MAETLTRLLQAALDPNPTTRAEAESWLKTAEKNNVEQYFVLLATEIANEESPVLARQMAGLLLKNALTSKDPARDRDLKLRWSSLSDQVRETVKEATVKALTTKNNDVGKACAQVLAKIGAMEVPAKQWTTLVPLLRNNVTNVDPVGRQISLTTLGYLCEDLVLIHDEKGLDVGDEANQILTAVVQGMRDSDTSIKLEGCKAFYHAVVLAHNSFQKKDERNYIMGVVHEACIFEQSEAVQVAAFEALVQVVTRYYDFISDYMEIIATLTLNTIKCNKSEKVSIPAMEFWSSICDEEIYLQELEDNVENGSKRCKGFIKMASSALTPLLLETMTKKTCEEDDMNSWNLAMAAASCLNLVVQVMGKDIIEPILRFVQEHFENPNWNYREAALLAYGSMMEGCTTEHMAPLVQSSYSMVLQRMNDSSVAVRDTVAWVIYRIACTHPSILPIGETLSYLGERLKDSPRVAVHVCCAIQCLAEEVPRGPDGNFPTSSPMSPFFVSLVKAFLEVSARPDAQERELFVSAYEALNSLVANCADDCLGCMDDLLRETINRLKTSYTTTDLQFRLPGQLCTLLQSIIRRLGDKATQQINIVMENCLEVMTKYQQACSRSVMLEEAMLLGCEIARMTGSNFEHFMPHFIPHFMVGLANVDEVQVCYVSTVSLGDLTNALQEKMLPYCDGIMEIVIKNLQSPNVDRKIKAAIMACFGDISMAISGGVEKYLPVMLKLLAEASATRYSQGPANDEDWIEYLNSLREGVFNAYVGIIHGLKSAGKLSLFKEQVISVLMLVKESVEDGVANMSVKKQAIGIVGDLILCFQWELTAHIQEEPFLHKLLEFAYKDNDPSLQTTAKFLQDMLRKYNQM